MLFGKKGENKKDNEVIFNELVKEYEANNHESTLSKEIKSKKKNKNNIGQTFYLLLIISVLAFFSSIVVKSANVTSQNLIKNLEQNIEINLIQNASINFSELLLDINTYNYYNTYNIDNSIVEKEIDFLAGNIETNLKNIKNILISIEAKDEIKLRLNSILENGEDDKHKHTAYNLIKNDELTNYIQNIDFKDKLTKPEILIISEKISSLFENSLTKIQLLQEESINLNEIVFAIKEQINMVDNKVDIYKINYLGPNSVEIEGKIRLKYNLSTIAEINEIKASLSNIKEFTKVEVKNLTKLNKFNYNFVIKLKYKK